MLFDRPGDFPQNYHCVLFKVFAVKMGYLRTGF